MASTMDPANVTDPVQDDINLATPDYFGEGDPHAIWKRLRAEDPVHLTKSRLSKPFWSVTRHEDAKFVLMNDHRIFSIAPNGHPHLPSGPEFEGDMYMDASTTAGLLSSMDGKSHSSLRGHFAERFNPSSVLKLESLVRALTKEALDDLLERGECDFPTDFGGRVPTAVIAAILGIPKEYWADLGRWNNMAAAPDDPEFSIGTPLETSTFAHSRIIETCANLAEEKRGKDGNDLLTSLTLAEINGKPLSSSEIGYNGLMFFGAGHETTRSSMSTGLFELLRHPEQLEYLRQNRHDAKVLRIAAEEFVRYSTPLCHTLRNATEDTVVGGQAIKKGDWVVVWFHSANRDERVFEDGERFNVRRTHNPHVGFAMGKHFCLGAYLARLDMQIMLEGILERLDEIEFAGPVELTRSNLFWGIKHMPIRFKRRAETTAQVAA